MAWIRFSNWSGTARKLFLGFGALVALFALSAWIAIVGLRGTHEAIGRMEREEVSVRLALELASAVRDQYAHQAHTIIIGDRSHLGFYAQAERRVFELTHRLRDRARDPEELGWVLEIESASRQLDHIFRERILPAVLRRDEPYVKEEHARAQLVVSRIQDLTGKLVDRFEARIAASRAAAARLESRTFGWVVALLAGAPLLAAAIVLSIGRSIAGPVARLREGAARVAAGDLEARMGVDSPDEFGELARQFDAMTAAVKEQQARLVQSEKLAGIGRLAAGVAHEINNPLAVILGYTRLLQKKAEGSLAEDLKVIAEETLRAQEIVEGMLELSRPLPAARERVELREACDEVVGRLREAEAFTRVGVSVEGSAAAEGHPLKLRQVISNLVRNAAEAAGPGGRVAVRVEERQGEARVEVEDSGPGLDEAARARIFEPFYTTKERGTGLGLAISRAIARAHGGEVEATGAPGGGARFVVRLPAAGRRAG